VGEKLPECRREDYPATSCQELPHDPVSLLRNGGRTGSSSWISLGFQTQDHSLYALSRRHLFAQFWRQDV
jgi:hypothetical protein